MKPNHHHITNYIHIKNNSVLKNGKQIFQSSEEKFSDFIKSVYKEFETDYPKFFKMDNLSKLAFMAAELILKEEDNIENTALVFSNNASSLDTDRKHQASISDEDNYYPSPAVFVYTLPNICLGEISIRHRLYSENSFFIFNRFNASHLYHYTNSLLDADKADKVLCGWVDFDGDDYEAFLYLVSHKGKLKHTIDEVERLYKTP